MPVESMREEQRHNGFFFHRDTYNENIFFASPIFPFILKTVNVMHILILKG